MSYSPNDFWWWKGNEDETASRVFSYIRALDTDQSYRTDENYRNIRLYGNLESFSLRNYNFFRAEPSSASQNRVTLNIIQSMVDTVVSKVTKNKPKPTFLTEGGDYSLQKRSQKLTQFIEGQFYACDFYAKQAQGFKDSCIFGTGFLKIYREGADIKAERVFPEEIVVNDVEAVYGEPRSMHQKKFINKDVLKTMFPDHDTAIDAVGSIATSQYASNSFDKNSSMLMVIESWHLRSGPDADDGLHTICIENQELFREEWTKDYFPFIAHRWSTRPLGYFGQGLSEQLTGLQLEINKILRVIQVSMHLVSVPKLFIEASSKIVSAHLNNKIGGIIKYVGQPPTEGKLASIPAELFAQLDRLYSRSFEIAGISQLSAQSTKPAGLDSGKALREFNDIESERFMEVAQRYEQTFLLASKMFIDLAKEIDEELDGEYAVKTKGRKFMTTIKWKDVNMAEDLYLMQCFPASSLSSTPAGRLQDVQELLAAGFIGKEDGMKLLDFPDLQQFYNFNNAGLEDIERTIEEFVDSGRYETPEPYQNLQLGITKMQQGYLYYRANGLSEDKLELFRRWIEDAGALLLKASQNAAPMPEAELPPAAPPVDPMAEAAAMEAAAAPVDPLAPDAAASTPELQNMIDLALTQG